MRFISLVLSYPEASFDYEGELEALRKDSRLEKKLFSKLERATQNLFSRPLLELQTQYVDVFDRGKGCSLYLFEHAYGDSLNRGEALVRLSHFYFENGYQIVDNELPDYVPMYFELLSTFSFEKAREKMSEIESFLKNIYESLMGHNPDYAVFLEIVMDFFKSSKEVKNESIA